MPISSSDFREKLLPSSSPALSCLCNTTAVLGEISSPSSCRVNAASQAVLQALGRIQKKQRKCSVKHGQGGVCADWTCSLDPYFPMGELGNMGQKCSQVWTAWRFWGVSRDWPGIETRPVTMTPHCFPCHVLIWARIDPWVSQDET